MLSYLFQIAAGNLVLLAAYEPAQTHRFSNYSNFIQINYCTIYIVNKLKRIITSLFWLILSNKLHLHVFLHETALRFFRTEREEHMDHQIDNKHKIEHSCDKNHHQPVDW